MNKKELRHLSSDCEYFLNGNGRGEINLHNFVENLRTTYIEPKENRIAELEETINKLREQLSLRYNLEDKITELKLKLEALEGQTPWKDIKDKSELIKENAELKCECRKCIHTDCPCVPSDYGKDRNGICDHFKDVFDENVDLKLKLKALEGQTPWKDIKDKSELIKENTKLNEHIENIYANHCGNCNRNILNTSLKKENAELENKIRFMGKQIDNLKAITKYDRFAKAIALLKDFVTLDKDCDWNLQLAYDAEQFLKETE